MKQFYNIFLILVIALCVFCGCSKRSYLSLKSSKDSTDDTHSETGEDTDLPESDDDESDVIYVQVAGAVLNPGVYKLHSDDRLYRAIEMAGGLVEGADESDLNLASVLEDGQKITVLTTEQIAAKSEAEDNSNLVNINSADASKLMTLPGIGESKALAIIKYRESKGSFSKKEDIMNISGIKEGVYNKIEDLITV